VDTIENRIDRHQLMGFAGMGFRIKAAGAPEAATLQPYDHPVSRSVGTAQGDNTMNI
jgi:hypothetical protein